MRHYVFQFPVDLPGGNYCVATASIPQGAQGVYDSNGAPARRHWTSTRLFKSKMNADKYLGKVYTEQRSYNLTMEMVDRGIMHLN